MDEEIKVLLGEVILKDLNAILDLPAGSAEKSRAVDDLTKLYKLKYDESRLEFDSEKFYAEMDSEDAARKANAEERKAEKKTETILAAAGQSLKVGELILDLLGIIAYCGIANQGFAFEESGGFTSMTFKNHLGKGFSALIGR
ncbi:MAG: hypothetical protein J6W86_06825 [Bacteroidales bacterium]|nr:hypothetical protein [Bacteroidales bacterium]